MDLFENPIALAQSIRQLHHAVVRWQQAMRRGELDDSGPFIGKPLLTTREAFREIRDSKQPEPLRSAWLRWAFYLSEARVNAAPCTALAHAYRVERHPVEHPEPLSLSLRELVARLLVRAEERSLWADLLSANASRVRRLAIEQVVRRDELARRAGFSGTLAVTLPDVDLSAWVERVLSTTKAVYREFAPTQLDRWLELALATSANRGWPAHLTPITVQHLLGSTEWFEGLNLPARSLPKAIAPTSFARALERLGSAVLAASAPAREPYVIAHDPYGLYRQAAGALFARLTTSEVWQARQLGLSRAEAREQARNLLVADLIGLRVKALAILVSERIRHSAEGIERSFAELSELCLGFCLPQSLAGVLPRLRVNEGQRLIGQCLAVQWSHELVAKFDTDWFRNPRAIIATRDTLSRVLPIAPTPEQENACVSALQSEFEAGL